MLISHKYKFIYTKTAKTAGTSVESFFEKFCMQNGEWSQAHIRDVYESEAGVIGYRGGNRKQINPKWWNHMPAKTIRKMVGDSTWNSYFKFCVIRNPFDKCISAFSHFGKNHEVVDRDLLDSEMTYEQARFLDFLRNGGIPLDRNKYLINSSFCLDDVVRFESLEADIERVCNELGIPFNEGVLPTFKTGKRSNDQTIEKLYTDAARLLVEQEFDYEIQRFGYKFPSK